MTRDRYDDMGTADLLREMCRKLDAIEKQGAPVKVTMQGDVRGWDEAMTDIKRQHDDIMAARLDEA